MKTARILAVALSAVILVGGGTATAFAADAEPEGFRSHEAQTYVRDDIIFPQLSSEENAMLNSGDPVEVTVDPATGKLVSVADASNLVEELSATQNDCSGSRACWLGWLSPHALWGFNGSGATGTWPNRGDFNTGVYWARPCWLSGGSTVCVETFLGPNTIITWGVELIGTRVDLTT